MLDFAAVGDNCIDRYGPPIGGSLVGGNAVNVAVQLARLGEQVEYFGAVGDDADGRRITETLTENGVDASSVVTGPGGTAHTRIEVDAAGDRTIAFEAFGACATYVPQDWALRRILTASHVHIGWLKDGGALRRRLVEAEVSVWQDVSVNADPRDLDVAGLDVAFASAGPDRDRAWTLLGSLLERGARLAVVTRGELGSIASDGSLVCEAAIHPVTVVDTTGAGDSFIAGFLSARRYGIDLGGCLESGSAVAAKACTHFGGFPQQPIAWP